MKQLTYNLSITFKNVKFTKPRIDKYLKINKINFDYVIEKNGKKKRGKYSKLAGTYELAVMSKEDLAKWAKDPENLAGLLME